MVPTLEGVLIALILVIAPANSGRAAAQNAAVATAKADVSSCTRYTADNAQRNCVARVLRAARRLDDAPYPSHVDWVAPPEPGLSQKAMLLRLAR
jgi:hypothetical protein